MRNGNRLSGLIFLFFVLTHIASSQSTPLICTPSAVPTLVRSEGLAERMGDILLSCSGGTAGQVITGNLTVFLSVNITNRLSADNSTDAFLSIDTGLPSISMVFAGQLVAQNAVAFNGLSFTIPPSQTVRFRITNLRGAANQQNLSLPQQPILAAVALNGPTGVTVNNSQFTVALPQRGLLATFSSTGVRCTGSPLPGTVNLANLFAAGTRFFSTRFTEGYAGAFQKRETSTDSGVRLVARYSGFPAGARLFVPDVVAGSSAVQPTAGGDLGQPPSGGQYAPSGAGSLLLVRVSSTDANGAGGTLVYTPGLPGSGTVSFNSISEVSLSNGAGMAVYEVVDANAAVRESAQFPTFIGFTPSNNESAPVAQEEISFGPISTVGIASTTTPVPRFANTPPPSDCPALQDCQAAYFPTLVVNSQPLQFSARAGSAFQTRYVPVNNPSGGFLNWTASVTYKGVSGWLNVDPPSGLNNGTVRVDAHPEKLAPGTYEAAILIDAGPLAGSRTLPVTFVVTALPALPPPTVAPPPVQPVVTVSSISNAASLQAGPLTPGSLATVKGAKLSGKTVSVTLNGVPAKLVYTSDSQINLQVPPELASGTTVQLIITVDGEKSAPQMVELVPASPAIFANGILNQDNSLNAPANPAPVGSIVQIFATGLPVTGTVTAKIHDRPILLPYYAGEAPGLVGVQQVNIAIPEDLPAMTTEVLVCAMGVCSIPARITIQEK